MTLARGASLSFAARGSFAFPCAGYARLATTATVRLGGGGGFSSGEHAGVLKWACGVPAAGEPKAVLSGRSLHSSTYQLNLSRFCH